MTPLAKELRDGGYTGSVAEIAAAMRGSVPLFENHERQTWASIGKALHDMGVDSATCFWLKGQLATVPRGQAIIAMVDQGVDLADDFVRAALQNVKADVPGTADDVLIDKILSIGKQFRPVWQKIGLAAAPSEADVETALAEIAARDWFARARDPGGPLHDLSMDSASIASLKAALGAFA